METLLDAKVISAVLGLVGLILVMWIKKRITEGYIKVTFESAEVNQIKQKTEDLQKANNILDKRCALLENQLKREKELSEMWQRKYIQSLEDR